MKPPRSRASGERQTVSLLRTVVTPGCPSGITFVRPPTSSKLWRISWYWCSGVGVMNVASFEVLHPSDNATAPI